MVRDVNWAHGMEIGCVDVVEGDGPVLGHGSTAVSLTTLPVIYIKSESQLFELGSSRRVGDSILIILVSQKRRRS